jgi:hypothetical protein
MAGADEGAKAPKLVRVTVARGRTVFTGKQHVKDGKVVRVEHIPNPPGTIIEVSPEEAANLRDLGAIENPNAPEIERVNFADDADSGRVTLR